MPCPHYISLTSRFASLLGRLSHVRLPFHARRIRGAVERLGVSLVLSLPKPEVRSAAKVHGLCLQILEQQEFGQKK